jgi:enamine deaminase RidA (YjgF/YER057c/UK114 family)
LAGALSVGEPTGVLKVGVFVQADAGFTDHALVANGASNLLQEIFGNAGRHVRFAVGVSSLPLETCVEVEFVFTS